jgi:glycosyltransferase involved in cell wall biosynthesis
MPKVSVVIPNYNHARFLRKRIDSVLQQTFQDFEVILLDDCSTDDSRSILSSYANDPRVRIEFNDANSGSTFKQWNKGVRLARGEYIWIAESDDYADPRFLERLVAVLDSKPQVVFVSCRSWQVDADGNVAGYADSGVAHWARYERGAEIDGREECQTYFVRTNTVCNASSVLFRKTVYDRIGGADERLRYSGDWKVWAAMALAGRVAYLSEPLNHYRVHETTVTAESKREGLVQAEYLHVVRWLLGKVTPTRAAREELNKTLRWFWTPAVTIRRVPLGRRWSILRDAIAIHPPDMRQMILAGLTTLRLKFLRHWRSARSGANAT